MPDTAIAAEPAPRARVAVEPAPEAPARIAAEPAIAADAPAAPDPLPSRASPSADAAVAAEPATGGTVAEARAATGPSAAVIAPDAERPAVGPKILGIAEPVKPLPSVKAAVPARKRRRRPSAAERHRRAFFSALTDLRRGATAPAESTAADPQATGAAEGAVAAEATAPEAPAVEAPPATAAQASADEPTAQAAPDAPQSAGEQRQPGAAAAVDRSASSPARVTAAIERVGGPEIIKEALKPTQDEKGQPLKWAAVCAQAAEGLKPGDPTFNAWVRLAATPVREVKGQLPRPPEQERTGRPGDAGARRPGGPRPGGERGGRPRRDDRSSRQEFASHAQDGSLRKSIRIVTGHDEDQERRERERIRKEQREAKRRAERERLARLGY
jgi:hypothetical protein